MLTLKYLSHITEETSIMETQNLEHYKRFRKIEGNNLKPTISLNLSIKNRLE